MPSVCRAGVMRRGFKARGVGSKLTFGCGLETYGYWLASLIAASYRTALFACRRAPSLNRSHITLTCPTLSSILNIYSESESRAISKM